MLARQVSEQDLADFDYIIAMDAENIGSLRSMAGFKNTSHIKRLLTMLKIQILPTFPILTTQGILKKSAN
ncbi:Low molecular weight protein-tyrosine-phosphatase YfkJ [Bacillus subtilis]|nr:Low molecular weight protein-tyrosine-phosphatase YfkJ [Bacillus subtilis]CUB47338.1 Low molecular weight protein-tyrosine-phosphatase YfkJ [Bacillus subtilis]CUB56084.1 Low molecular weight protein-tyrosine-phosphatase YfkJ [Bacillus subtilis]